MRRLAILAATVAAAMGMSAHRAQAQTVVTCESVNGRQNVCAMDTSGGVRLVKTFSLTPCEQGQTWGLARGGVWVSNGCRAQFATAGVSAGSGRYGTYGRDVYGRDVYGRYDNSGRYDANTINNAVAMCRQAVRQQIGNRRLATSVENNSRNNIRIAFRSGNGMSGTCRVNRDGNVTVRFYR